MEKARTALASARLLLSTDGATNRAYYAMFDAAIAALTWAGADIGHSPPKTHSGLIASFGEHLIRTGKLAAEFGRSLNRVQELRLSADYLAAPVSPEKAQWAIDQAASFVEAVAALPIHPKPSGA